MSEIDRRSQAQLQLAPSTVNHRAALVARFYKWAYENQHIDHNPIRYKATRRWGERGLLTHVGAPQLMTVQGKAREHRVAPQILTLDQIKYCRQNIANESHRLLFELMVQSGLRSCEARSFPASIVFNPRLRKELVQDTRTMLAVDLNPREMQIKFNKPRTVHITWTLMEDLNAYAMHRRSGLQRPGQCAAANALLLSANGTPFTKDGLTEIFKALERRVGFRVRPHMLRHSYATHVLRALRMSKGYQGEPLLYVRDRLGHSDVQTTSVYLHLIEQMEGQLVLAYEDHIDELFGKAATLE